MRTIGFWTILTLVALRIGIGWHFFAEGAKKFKPGKSGESFTSVPFLNAAKGPWADQFKAMIPDRLGHERLLEPSKTIDVWKGYQDQVGRYYGFDDKQTKAAEDLVDRFDKRLKSYLETNKDDIREYFLATEHLQKLSQEKTRDIQFQRERLTKMEADLRGKGAPWIKGVDALEHELQVGLRDLANDVQRRRAPLPVVDRFRPNSDTIVKFVNVTVGGLLIVGLLTRPAALVAMAFLMSVIATQPPWVEGVDRQYLYYQVVEILALGVLVATGAGRFAGLDYVLYAMWTRCCPPKKNPA